MASKRADKYPISMEELRRTCPLIEVDVVSDGRGGDILIGRWKGATHVSVPCKKVTKAAVEKFQEAYYKAVKIGIIKSPVAAPAASSADNVVPIDTAGNNATPADASSDIPVEDEPTTL